MKPEKIVEILSDHLPGCFKDKIIPEIASEISKQQDQEIKEIFGQDRPYPLKDVLLNLRWATNYLLYEKDYDGHNYETLNECRNRVDEIINNIDKFIHEHELP